MPTLSLAPIVESTIAPAAVERTVAAIRQTKRGLLFVGSGARRGAGPQRLIELAERVQWPVVTTPKAKAYSRGFALSLGVFGMGGHSSTYDYLEKGLDTLIAIGTSLNELSTDGWSSLLQPSGEFIHVDVDERQFGRAYACTLGIVGTAEQFCGGVAARVPQAQERQFGGIRRHVLGLGSGAGLPLHHAIGEIQKALPADAIYTVDSGEHFVFATHYLKTTAPDAYIVMTGLGSDGAEPTSGDRRPARASRSRGGDHRR